MYTRPCTSLWLGALSRGSSYLHQWPDNCLWSLLLTWGRGTSSFSYFARQVLVHTCVQTYIHIRPHGKFSLFFNPGPCDKIWTIQNWVGNGLRDEHGGPKLRVSNPCTVWTRCLPDQTCKSCWSPNECPLGWPDLPLGPVSHLHSNSAFLLAWVGFIPLVGVS